MSDKKKDKKPSRTSILKPRKSLSQSELNDSNSEAIPSRDVRRVSFASINSVKPFVADPEKNTIWDNTYEEALNHTDSTSETKGFLDTNFVNPLTFDDNDEMVKDGPFFVISQNTSVTSVSIRATDIDECNKENYVPLILTTNPFVVGDSIHINERLFNVEMKTSEIQFTNVAGMQSQNMNSTMELTCLPSILTKNDTICANACEDMELTDVSLKLPDLQPTSNLLLTNTGQQFDPGNKENINLAHVLPITTNILSKSVKVKQPSELLPDVAKAPQSSKSFINTKTEEMKSVTIDTVNNVTYPDMQLTCVTSALNRDIPEKDFDNSEVSMEVTSNVLADVTENTNMKHVGNAEMNMSLTCVLPTDNLGNVLQKSTENAQFVQPNNNIDTSMQLTCVIPTAGTIISNTVINSPNDVDTNMQFTCVYSETEKDVQNSGNTVPASDKFSENISNGDIKSSMQLTCVLPAKDQIISSNANKDVTACMELTCVQTPENTSNVNIDTSMEFTRISPTADKIVSNIIQRNKIIETNTNLPYSEMKRINKHTECTGSDISKCITDNNIDTSMQFTCVFPPTGQILLNNVNDTNKSMDTSMQFTCVFPEISKYIKDAASTGIISDKSPENSGNASTKSSMQPTSICPTTGQITSNNTNDTNKVMDTSMQFTCVFPEMSKNINAAVTSNTSPENIGNTNNKSSMKPTSSFPNTGQIVSNNVNDANQTMDTSMQFTCVYSEVSKLIKDAAYVGDKSPENIGNVSVKSSTQPTSIFPTTGLLISNNVNYCKEMDTSMQFTCTYPDAQKVIKTSTNAVGVCEKSKNTTNKNVDTSMQFTCVLPATTNTISNQVNNGNILDDTSNKNSDTNMQFTCIIPQTSEGLLKNNRPDNVTNNCEDSNMHSTNVFPTEIVNKDPINNVTELCKNSKNINKTLCDMTLDKTSNMHETLYHMSIDETQNVEGMEITYANSGDGMNMSVSDNHSAKNITYVKSAVHTKPILMETYLLESSVKAHKQINDETYFVPLKKTKFEDELQIPRQISHIDQQCAVIDEYKRKSSDKALNDDTPKFEMNVSCEEAGSNREHKKLTLEADKLTTNPLMNVKNKSDNSESQEHAMVSRMITRSRNQFLKFREEYNSAKQKQTETTTLTEIKDTSVPSPPSSIEKKPDTLSKDPEFYKELNLHVAIEDTTCFKNNAMQQKGNTHVPTKFPNVVTRSQSTLSQHTEERNLKTDEVKDKKNKTVEVGKVNSITPSGVVTRSRNRVLKPCDDSTPNFQKEADENNAVTCSKISKITKGNDIENSIHIEKTDKKSSCVKISRNDLPVPCSNSNELPENGVGDRITCDVKSVFGPNDTTLTIYDSSPLKESSNNYENNPEIPSVTSTNNRTTTNQSSRPGFSFDICRSSTLVNRCNLNDDSLDGSSNLNKETKMKLTSDVLQMDESSSSFALLSNIPSVEYPGKKIYSTCIRPLFSLKRNDNSGDYSTDETDQSMEDKALQNSPTTLEPATQSKNTPKNKSLLLCDTSPIIVDMTNDDDDDDDVKDDEKQILHKTEARLSNSCELLTSEYQMSLQNILEEFKQCSILPYVELPKACSGLIQKLDEASKKTESLLQNCNFYKREIVDLEEISKLENFASLTTSRFSDEMLSAEFMDNNTGEDTGLSDINMPTFLEDKIREALSRSEKYCEFVKVEDDFYYFYTYERAIPFKVKVHPDSGFVDQIYTYTNLKDDVEPLFRYNSKFLLEKLKNENLLLALGGKFDVLTLLDYVSICMEEVIDFSTEFNKLEVEYGPSHKFRMNSDSSVCVEVLNIKYVIWWIITIQLSVHNLGTVEHIEAAHIYEEVDEKQIQSLGKNFSGSLQLRNFIVNLNQHVEKVGKRVLAYMKNELAI